MKNQKSYENYVVGLMALIFGCIFFDRLALNFLIPFVKKDLDLNNTQIGLLAGGLALAWALSSYFTTAFAENKNKKRLVFFVGIVVFSLSSFGSGLAMSFGVLLLARVIMGIAEGPIVPMAQSFVEKESSPNRLGLNSGILQAVGSALFGSIIAPVLLVEIAQNMGWRQAFYIAGVPGLLFGLIFYFTIRKSTTEAVKGEKKEEKGDFKELLRYKNIPIAMGIACCIFGWWFGTLPFISDYFVNTVGMSEDTMGKTMGILGISSLFSSILVPGLSDKFGRKPVLLVVIAIGAFYPMVVQYFSGTGYYLPLLFITYFMMGTIPLAAAVLPLEAVPGHLKSKAMGLIAGVGEIFGGVLVPAVAGILSDKIAPNAFLWVSSSLAVVGLVLVSIYKKE
ncbi:MAG: hypothetical protein RIR51_1032, partial [Bacteroidota bacterium]